MRSVKEIVLLLVLGTLATSSVVPSQPKNELNDALRDLLEAVRRQMPCGWPDAGIPPLVPLFINSTQRLTIGVENLLDLQFDLTNIEVRDLDRFIVTEIDMTLWTLRINYKIMYPRIKVLAENYVANGRILQTPIINRSGKFEMDFFDLEIAGHIQLWTIPTNQEQWMDINDMEAKISVASARANLQGLGGLLTNTLLNIALENQIPDAVASSSEGLNVGIRNAVMPFGNGALNFITAADLLEMIINGEGIGGGTCP